MPPIIEPLALVMSVLLLPIVWAAGRLVGARLLNTRIVRISIGPPVDRIRLWSMHRGDREYRIAWLPVGIFTAHEPTAAPWRRALLAFAGPLALLLAGWLLLYTSIHARLPERVTGTLIARVAPDSPAAHAGIQPGDRIVACNDVPTVAIHDFRARIDADPTGTLSCRLDRAGQRVDVDVRPVAAPGPDGVVRGQIGVMADPAMTVPLENSWRFAFDATQYQWSAFVRSVTSAITGYPRTIDALGGPVLMRTAGPVQEPAPWLDALTHMALLAWLLALLQMLPVPPFALFEIAIIVIEAIRRRPRTASFHRVTGVIGMVIAGALIIVFGLATMQGCRNKEIVPASGTGAGTSTRAALGAPCHRSSECIEGAVCSYATCDIEVPCGATVRGPDGVTVRHYRFDARGRNIGWEETRDDKVVARDFGQWSDDGRTYTWQTWFDDPNAGGPADETGTIEHDARGDVTTITTMFGQDVVDHATYAWSKEPDCRAPTVTTEMRGATMRSRATCGADGSPSRIEQVDADGTVLLSRAYTYENGRLRSVVTIGYARIKPSLRTVRTTFKRDARGIIVEAETDVGDDGSIDRTEVRDYTCYDFTSDPQAVRIRPR